jgi:leucyl aminopeptidase
MFLGLEAAKPGEGHGMPLGHLVGKHIQNTVERFANLSPGKPPGAATAGDFIDQLSFVHDSVAHLDSPFGARRLLRPKAA